MVKLLAIDDDAPVLDFIERVLTRPELSITRTSDPFEGWDLVRRNRPDIVLLDQNMPGLTGMELLARIAEWDPSIEVVILTSEHSTDLAVDAIQKGASDFLTKPIEPLALRERMDTLIAAAERRQATVSLEEQLLHASKFGDMVGNSAPMMEVFSTIRRIAP